MTPSQQVAIMAANLLRAFEGPVVGGHSVQLKKISEAATNLRSALGRYEGHQRLFEQQRTRLGDDDLKKIMEEECDAEEAANGSFEDGCGRVMEAGLRAMRRISNYAEHLHQVLVTLSQTIDLEKLLFTLAEAERRANNLPRINWMSPSIKPLAEIIAEIMSEVKTTEPPKAPVAEQSERS